MANINDVAKLAGVSISTVSLAINCPVRVSEDTKQKIFKAIKELRYIPSVSSKNVRLSSSKKNSVALITSEISGPYFYEIMRGISETLALNDLEMILLCGADAQKRHFDEMAKNPFVCGIILLAIDEPIDKDGSEAIKRGVPVVTVNAKSGLPDFGSVNVDNYNIGETVGNHILHIGHKRIALFGERSRERIPRAEGFINALLAVGKKIPPELDVPVFLDEKSGFAAMEKFLEDEIPLPDAIFCLNDEIALGAITSLRQHGVSVPQQVAIIGCDDISASRYADPTLTTMAMPKFEQGMLSVIQLLWQSSGKKPENTILNAKLVIRESCGYNQRLSKCRLARQNCV
jgi:DNA-binding LacI/PurR family transcriptional regulator